MSRGEGEGNRGAEKEVGKGRVPAGLGAGRGRDSDEGSSQEVRRVRSAGTKGNGGREEWKRRPAGGRHQQASVLGGSKTAMRAALTR